VKNNVKQNYSSKAINIMKRIEYLPLKQNVYQLA